MPNIPGYFEAKQISTMLITPQTADCDGALTAVGGSAIDVITTATFNEFVFAGSPNLFEYSPAHAQVENYQPGKETWQARLSCLDLNRKAQALLDLYTSYTILRIAARAGCPPAGGATYGKYLVVIGRIAEINTTWREGKNMTDIMLRPVGIPAQWATTPTI